MKQTVDSYDSIPNFIDTYTSGMSLVACSICKITEIDAPVENRRLCTLFVDEKRNWIASCEQCFEMADDHYAELIAEYYRNCM